MQQRGDGSREDPGPMADAHSEVLTSDQWLKVLTQYQQLGWGTHYPRERRTQRRSQVRAVARLIYLGAEGGEERAERVSCPVLDVSTGGLAIRSYRKIAPGTRLAIDMSVADRRLRLLGTVVRCTGIMGAVRVGIRLEFSDGDKTAAAEGG